MPCADCSIESKTGTSGKWKYKTPSPSLYMIFISKQNSFSSLILRPVAHEVTPCLLCWHGQDLSGARGKSFLSTQKICTLTLFSDALTAACTCKGSNQRNKHPQITTCTGPSPHPNPSLSVCLSFPLCPIPLFLLSSTTPSRRKPGLPENKHCSVERDKAEGGRYARGSRGCFCRSSAPVVAAGLTVVHPEETRLTSLWPGLGPTHAAC